MSKPTREEMMNKMVWPDDFVNKIICGDCLEVMPMIPDKSIDMILADLPYGITAYKWDSAIPLKLLWEQYKRIIKDNGIIALSASQPFTSMLVMSNLKMFKYEWIWDKVRAANFMNIKNRPFKIHENILIFSKNANFTYNPIRIKRTEISLKRDPIGGKSRLLKRVGISEHYNTKGKTIFFGNSGMKNPVDIIKFNIIDNSLPRYNNKLRGHAKKPIALFEYLIKTYTNEDDLVLDNVLGSGTTSVACKQLNRNFIGIEINPDYCKIAEERLAQGVF